MKTLDEVIKALEICTSGYCSNPDGYCPYLNIDNDCDTRFRKLDALEYLKEYRTKQNILRDSKEHYEYFEHKYYAELEKNDPLDWETLKTMEGKPVWVEDEDSYSRWEIINGVYDDGISFVGNYYLNKNEFGDVWKAYRKERE